MRNQMYFLFMGLVVTSLLFLPGCQTTEDVVVQYTLTVNVGEGVNGTPATGSYPYNENDLVPYSYSAQSGYGHLAVTLDGAPVPESGTVTMTGNHQLGATAERLIDIRGFWEGTMYNQSASPFLLSVTFSGTLESGSVSGYGESAGNGNGEYTVSGDQINFNLQFYSIDVWYQGTITDDNNMNGEWTSSESPYGSWELERN